MNSLGVTSCSHTLKTLACQTDIPNGHSRLSVPHGKEKSMATEEIAVYFTCVHSFINILDPILLKMLGVALGLSPLSGSSK
jgi:hypothetical protein